MTNRTVLFLRHNLLAVLWSGFIMLLCGLPGSELPEVGIMSFDKMAHTFLFLVLVFLSIKGFKTQNIFRIFRYHSIKLSLTWAFFLGIISEVLQEYLFVDRTGDVYDVLANITGSLLGIVAFYLIYGKGNTFRLS